MMSYPVIIKSSQSSQIKAFNLCLNNYETLTLNVVVVISVWQRSTREPFKLFQELFKERSDGDDGDCDLAWHTLPEDEKVRY